MKKHPRVATGVVALITAIVFVSLSFRQEAQTASQQTDDATVVKRGNATDKEREYSKEYRKLYPGRSGSKISELIEVGKQRGKGKEVGFSIGEPSYPTVGVLNPPTAEQFLGNLSCKADAIVAGTARRNTAHLTDDEALIFTEYEFTVDEVLKNNVSSPINPKDTIQITRPGGLVNIDGQLIRFVDRSYKPLQLRQNYLLFLKYVRGANGYLVSDEKGNFLLENDTFKQAFGANKELNGVDTAMKLVESIRMAATAGGCSQRKES